MSVIGDNIRALRIREDLTQQELADIAQVTRETVNKWETGTIEALREHNIRTIREYFNLSVDDLRSESNGIAAQLRGKDREGFDGRAIPVYSLEDLSRPLSYSTYLIEYLAKEHPRAFAIEMDQSMDRVMPQGCLALVDPAAKAQTGSIVLAELYQAEGEVPVNVVRRMYQGSNKVFLTSESASNAYEDLVAAYDQLALRGRVFWFQPSKELT